MFKGKMVRPGGFELPTFWFVARRSIQLSYGRAVFAPRNFPEHAEVTHFIMRQAGSQIPVVS
jgi:hypothetical protein